MSTTRPPAYDERFATPIDASRRGAHRSRPRPVSAGLPVLAGIAVVLVVIGGVYTVLGNHKSSSGTAVVTSTAQASSTPQASATAVTGSTGVASTGSATTPAATTAPTPASTGTTGTGTVDRSVTLKVLNSVGVQGLAKKVQNTLDPDGWTVAGTGNSVNRNLAVTKVYYGSSKLKATAKAMVQDLGYGTTVLDSSVAPKGLVVVLGQDAE